jgi:lipid II:glycine glycyltransferase (peptidoglycan interpeptide bridge formation enzyme)
MAGAAGVLVNEVDRHAWPSIISAFHDRSYEQTDTYTAAMAGRSGGSARFFTVTKDAQLLGAAGVRVKKIRPLGRGVAYIAAGPMTLNGEADADLERRKVVLRALKTKLVDEDGHYLFVRMPLSPALDRNEAEALAPFLATTRVRPYRTFVIDLRQSTEALRANLDKRWRRGVKYSERANLQVERGASPEMLRRFLAMFAEMHQVKGFPISMDPAFLLALPSDALGIELLIATKDGRDAAGHVLSIVGETAIYLFGATNELGRSARAGYLLHWHALLLGKERDVRWYDLGGVNAAENSGGYSFKKGMGGREMVASGPYEARPDGSIGFLIDKLLSIRHALRRFR